MIVRGIPRESRSSSGPYANKKARPPRRPCFFICTGPDTTYFRNDNKRRRCASDAAAQANFARRPKLTATEPDRSQSSSSSAPVLCAPTGLGVNAFKAALESASYFDLLVLNAVAT